MGILVPKTVSKISKVKQLTKKDPQIIQKLKI